MEDYFLDDNLFAEGAGINKISEAYSKVFQKIEDLASEGKSFAEAGSTKEILSSINKITSRVAALVEISEMDKKVVNSNGTVFNVFGEEDDSDFDDSDDQISELDLIEKLNGIIDGCTDISFGEIQSTDNKNIKDDGLDHGDLDFLW